MSWLSTIITALFGGALTGYFTYQGVKVKTHGDTESVYASHFPEFFNALQKTLDERDKLASQVVDLQVQLQVQTDTIKDLREQIQKLTKEIEELRAK